MRYIHIIFLCLVWTAISCEGLDVSEIPDYPLKIEPLGLLELDDLNTKYQEENANLCSTLNEFGFTGYSRILFPNDINPCNNKEIIRVELQTPDTLVSKAIDAVIKNRFYTNVTDAELLEVQEIVPLYGCTICEGPETNSVPLEWKITFSAQRIDGLEVFGSEINVFVDILGVNRIWGNWIPDFYAPGLLDVGYIQAEMEVIGKEIELASITGQDSSFVVTEEHVIKPSVLQIFPYVNEFGELEFRKTWKVTVGYTYEEMDEIFGQVDAIDGELLEFVTTVEEE
ncbi:MAG: hypothetical protein MI700_00835 [Balneolales bacterium]|nr:hypothetical protein [Balneolales bacterium]